MIMAKQKRVPRAGLIPYIYQNDELLMMFMKPSCPKYGGDCFQIAKGKVEDGETAMEAAIREAEEELGLRKSNLINTYHLGLYLGYTDIFYGKVKSLDDFGETTHETSETIWMNVEDFCMYGRTIHIPAVRHFVATISPE